MVKLGPELMGANPYSVKRARPLSSTITFACGHVSNVTKQSKKRDDGLLPSSPHARYRANEGIPDPLRHRTAMERKDS